MTPTTATPTPNNNQPLFTASAPFDARKGDTLVIYCADGRFRAQTHEFLTQHLKLDRPVTITVPGGISIFMPIVGFAHKVVKKWLDSFSEHAKRVIVIAHEDCAAYQAEHGILEAVVTRITGSPVKDLQRKHLAGALSMLRVWYPHTKVEAYYAEIVDGESGAKKVIFTQVTT
jgi:hypothetical protein